MFYNAFFKKGHFDYFLIGQFDNRKNFRIFHYSILSNFFLRIHQIGLLLNLIDTNWDSHKLFVIAKSAKNFTIVKLPNLEIVEVFN